MKRFFFSAVIILGLIGCKEKSQPLAPQPVKSVGDLIAYRESSGAFEIAGPPDWQVREDKTFGPSVTLLGPGNSMYPRSVAIHVTRYPSAAAPSPDPRSYYKSLESIASHRILSPYAKRTLGGRDVESYAVEAPFRRPHQRKAAYQRREDVAIIAFPGGFYRIDHAAPVEIYAETLPIFEAVVASFKPGSTATSKTP